MCGRYVTRMEAAAEREWHVIPRDPARWLFGFVSYNVAPTQLVPVIRAFEGVITCEPLRWGLIPFWAKGIPPKLSLINARIENVTTAASYRGPWKRGQRCILPAVGFYEWQALEGEKRKQPWFVHLGDKEVFGFAGLWDSSVDASGNVVASVTIITMPANPFMAHIHTRMPAILQQNSYEAWLAGDESAARACLLPYPDAEMAAHTVSTAVNSPTNNQPELIAPADPISPKAA